MIQPSLQRKANADPVEVNGGWQMHCSPDGDIELLVQDFGGYPYLKSRLHHTTGSRHGDSGAVPHVAINYINQGQVTGTKDARGVRRIYERGDIVIWHSNQAQRFCVIEPLQQTTLIFPTSALRGSLSHVECLTGMHLPSQGGLGPMISGFFAGLVAQAERVPRHQHAAALQMTIDLLSKAVSAERESKLKNGGDEWFTRLVHYIDQHLQNPDLTPSVIARENLISLRYLHLIFARKGLKVAALIRQRRMEHAKIALRSADKGTSITEIAFRMGFQDSAHFSRLFRQHCGMSPIQFRHCNPGISAKSGARLLHHEALPR